jgi:hypothetical protein
VEAIERRKPSERKINYGKGIMSADTQNREVLKCVKNQITGK